MHLSIAMLTKNNAALIARVLDAVRFCPEVVILDNGSEDATLAIASRFPNVRIFESPFTTFGDMRRRCAALASNDWIFALDSDEIVSDELQKELQQLTPDDSCVYSVLRRNYYRGQPVRHCWKDDRPVRLYNRRRTDYSDHHVHERVLTEGLNEVRLNGTLDHYSYNRVHDFLAKMQRYSDLSVQQNPHKSSSFGKALMASWYNFFKFYILKGGFLDGSVGYLISKSNADTTFYKYLKAKEAAEDAAMARREGKSC